MVFNTIKNYSGLLSSTVCNTEIVEGNIKGTGEEGEICIRCRNIMKGYLNKPEENASVFGTTGSGAAIWGR